jgi:hypothetical protein
MHNPTAHNSYWSLRLLAILQEMAAQKTNVVLELLGNIGHLKTGRSYPENGLLFSADRWRAFYHCHEATSMHQKEHGHFHIFTAIGNQAWAHVAGLSIDAEGQPLQWFTVNRWVTDGPWLERDRLLSQLKTAAADSGEESLAGRWLVALLQLYHGTLTGLLIKRDEQIQLRLKGRSKIEALDDRDIYTLATQSIDLQSMLEKHLLQNACPDAEPGRHAARNPVCNSI